VTPAELAARVQALEDETERQQEINRHLVATVELLAELAGARPSGTRVPDAARPALRVIPGGVS
jgi:hypothetical protein